MYTISVQVHLQPTTNISHNCSWGFFSGADRCCRIFFFSLLRLCADCFCKLYLSERQIRNNSPASGPQTVVTRTTHIQTEQGNKQKIFCRQNRHCAQPPKMAHPPQTTELKDRNTVVFTRQLGNYMELNYSVFLERPCILSL